MTECLEAEFSLFIQLKFYIYVSYQVVFVACIGIVAHITVDNHPVVEKPCRNGNINPDQKIVLRKDFRENWLTSCDTLKNYIIELYPILHQNILPKFGYQDG